MKFADKLQEQLLRACFDVLFMCRHRLASGTSEKIQLSSLIAAFQVARDLVAMEAE